MFSLDFSKATTIFWTIIFSSAIIILVIIGTLVGIGII